MGQRPHASKTSIPMIKFISPGINFSSSLIVSEQKRKHQKQEV